MKIDCLKDGIGSFFNVCQRNLPLLLEFSWGEIKARYARSILGPFWLVLTTAISALGLSYIWSILFNQDKETFIPSLTIGLVIWQFISTCINEAPYCFNTYSSIIRNYSYPIIMFPSALVFKNFFVFLHNFLIVMLVLMIYPPDISLNFLLIIPAMILVIANLIVAVTIVSMIGARYKDFGPAVNSLMTIVFFLSPVMYKPEQLSVREYLMWFNPFSYLITLIRDPITGVASPLFVYAVMIGTLLIGGLWVWYLVSHYRYRVVLWL